MVCTKCTKQKPITEFSKNKKAINGYRKQCAHCHQEQIRGRRRKMKLYWVTEMGGYCQSCGFNLYLGPMQFHHVNEKKEHDPNKIMYAAYNEERIRNELDHCCLLCSNCHDAFHSKELNVKFIKRNGLGWTVTSSEVVIRPLNICPTEDKGVFNFKENHGI